MENYEDLTLSRAAKPEGVLLLGALVLRQLQVRGQCSFFVNALGVIEIANPVELALDALSEHEAIRALSEEHKYTDDQIVLYLRGREARAVWSAE